LAKSVSFAACCVLPWQEEENVAGTNEDVIRAVLDSWGVGIEAAQAATRQHFTDDCRWEQTGLPTTTGGEEAAQMLGSMSTMGFSAIAVDYRNVAATGDVVCTERVDWLVRPDGSRVGPLPVVGITEFRDGKISSWREYFDSANLALLGGG
jgi:limonene-1,2-epoxide hydrolase